MIPQLLLNKSRDLPVTPISPIFKCKLNFKDTMSTINFHNRKNDENELLPSKYLDLPDLHINTTKRISTYSLNETLVFNNRFRSTSFNANTYRSYKRIRSEIYLKSKYQSPFDIFNRNTNDFMISEANSKRSGSLALSASSQSPNT